MLALSRGLDKLIFQNYGDDVYVNATPRHGTSPPRLTLSHWKHWRNKFLSFKRTS